MIRLAALLCGLLCGAGVVLSGVFQPGLLADLLNPAAKRDLTLALTLITAFIVAAVILALTRKTRPLLGGEVEPAVGPMSARTVAGAVAFGLGWGLAGFFPLSALVALGLFAPDAAIFLASVLGGMLLHDLIANRGRLRIEGFRSRG